MAAVTSVTLSGSNAPLAELFDVALLDLDGVVYIGADAVPGVPEALKQARVSGMRLAFVTNNAARPPQAVAEHLNHLGIAAEADEVVNSSQAAAHYLADRLPAGAKVLVVGTEGLHVALRERGLVPVTSADDAPAAVVQGYSPTLSWQDLAEGAVAIGTGVPWVATNLDPTVPSPRGPLPGNGSLVAALRHATGVTPIVTGKPEPTMHRESVERSGAVSPIVVGDRLDTDIEGANAVGCPSLLVLSGVTGAADLLIAPLNQRPNYLGHDLAALLYAHPAPTGREGGWTCGPWRAEVSAEGGLTLARSGDGDETADGLDALRALCAAAWSVGESAHPDWTVQGRDEPARAELVRLSLA
ncbi:HAD-IIA family hydrolase [Jatrophihabitans sp.]|uniref:HAD-IIA family hydrolase n=1 Tax=Jatrophihabitans sp. TaxID=1932789 RepID=UPI0030C68F32|nr:hypothetical protein [Jatrophihabitans sp.]